MDGDYTLRARRSESHPQSRGRRRKGPGDGLRCILKELGGKHYLITVNAGTNPISQAKITVGGITGDGKAEVKFEDRTVPVKDGAIVDDFTVGERHVYVF